MVVEFGNWLSNLKLDCQVIKSVIMFGNWSASLEIGGRIWNMDVKSLSYSSSLEISHRVWKLVVDSGNWLSILEAISGPHGENASALRTRQEWAQFVHLFWFVGSITLRISYRGPKATS